MKVGIPRELRTNEYRVGMIPQGVHELVRYGHTVLVERGAGEEAYFTDEEFAEAGATLVGSREDVWGEADLVVKVSQPVEVELDLIRPGQVLFSFLHLATEREIAKVLLERKAVAIACETVVQDDGTLPLLRPMSEIAGRLAPQVGATQLMKANGGRGVLMGGVPGVPPAKVVVIGAGNAGFNAAKIATGMHADVAIVDADVNRLRYIDNIYQGHVGTYLSTSLTIEHLCLTADLVIGAALVTGAPTPKLVPNDLVAAMRAGSVLVDVAIDQGGCFEGSRPTTHGDPTFRVHDSLFYCVTNMPSGVARTATKALANNTLPYALSLASNGWREALRADHVLARGLNVAQGRITHPAVGEGLRMEYVDVESVL